VSTAFELRDQADSPDLDAFACSSKRGIGQKYQETLSRALLCIKNRVIRECLMELM